ncbi:MAG: nucleotidyltransferase domain-containing protein [Nitrospira sp.]|nr:nucleotidyltransferase domain-containing protein [Nitrospira sp.]
MIQAIVERTTELEQLCRRYHVQRLEVFGSATDSRRFRMDSDLDFLVEFQPFPPCGHANAYFGLLEDLQEVFGRPVDLVSSSAIKNPYFRESVEETKELLYAA